jgi:hypothetical protein
MFSRIDMISFPFFCHRGNSHIPISLIIILHTELILFFFHDYQTKYRDMMPPRYNCYLFSYFQQSVSVLPYLLVGLMDRSLFKADRSLFCTSSPPFFYLIPFLSLYDRSFGFFPFRCILGNAEGIVVGYKRSSLFRLFIQALSFLSVYICCFATSASQSWPCGTKLIHGRSW